MELARQEGLGTRLVQVREEVGVGRDEVGHDVGRLWLGIGERYRVA
jgi:hypothetical protein